MGYIPRQRNVFYQYIDQDPGESDVESIINHPRSLPVLT
jgi:hypothetical protein